MSIDPDILARVGLTPEGAFLIFGLLLGIGLGWGAKTILRAHALESAITGEKNAMRDLVEAQKQFRIDLDRMSGKRDEANQRYVEIKNQLDNAMGEITSLQNTNRNLSDQLSAFGSGQRAFRSYGPARVFLISPEPAQITGGTLKLLKSNANHTVEFSVPMVI